MPTVSFAAALLISSVLGLGFGCGGEAKDKATIERIKVENLTMRRQIELHGKSTQSVPVAAQETISDLIDENAKLRNILGKVQGAALPPPIVVPASSEPSHNSGGRGHGSHVSHSSHSSHSSHRSSR